MSLQDTLLHHLGISLNPAATEAWPLRVRSRTLAVLAEILLLRQQNERDTASSSSVTVKRASETAVMHIWTRLTTALADAAIATDVAAPAAEVDDINVEYLQLVTFLFHNSLTLMQKKSLLLQLCQAIVRICESLTETARIGRVVPLPLTRLLLIADYLLHHFYDMPTSLVDQVGCYRPIKMFVSFFVTF